MPEGALAAFFPLGKPLAGAAFCAAPWPNAGGKLAHGKAAGMFQSGTEPFVLPSSELSGGIPAAPETPFSQCLWTELPVFPAKPMRTQKINPSHPALTAPSCRNRA